MTTAAVLLPDWKRCVASEEVATGVLARWCSRGNRLPLTQADPARTLGEVFQWDGTALPVAALSRQLDVGDAAGSAWLRADPAFVRADMVTARMLACGELGLSMADCAAIAADLKPLFGDSGFEFDARLPNRWYLRAPKDSDLPRCASPDEAIGDDLKLHLPEGVAGRRWRQLFNEAQIILHNHPVNAARNARGAVSVNSLWFWGAGVLPDWVRSRATGVLSDRIEVRALSALASLKPRALDATSLEDALASSPGGVLLIDLFERRQQELERDWLQPLDRLLRGGKFESIDLLFASGERFHVRAAHRLRFWRSLTALAR